MSIATHPAAKDHATPRRAPGVRLRGISPGDHEVAARITYEAFAGIHDRHRFPRDFPSLDVARELVAAFSTHPSIWGVVAESDGRVVGSNFLDERGPVRGVGPITVDPGAQAAGIGRLLMEAVIERGARGDGIRLLQDSFNSASLALYSSLGFRVEEPVALVAGTPSASSTRGVVVRPLGEDDIPACEALCVSVHGFERTRELRDALDSPGLSPYVALRGGRIVAYAATFDKFGAAYAVAESEDDMAALIAGAVVPDGPPASFLLPLHQHDLLRWCLAAGLRIVKPMNYMVMGPYRRPQGAWIPSVLY
ncbi:MAG TPA: GNAT family N-acetyltransferase [Thermoleophilaceae bacterium]|nr:GNAT family N-acetyltransferase [Thermoleophilaceae bacterium]